jgi:hypothetical protein
MKFSVTAAFVLAAGSALAAPLEQRALPAPVSAATALTYLGDRRSTFLDSERWLK